MDLRVDDSALRSLVEKSIVDSLTPEAREKIIAQAVTALLTINESGYSSRKTSALQDAFNSAVRNVAERHAFQMLTEDPEFQAKIKSLFADVAEKLFADEGRTALVEKMAGKMASALVERY